MFFRKLVTEFAFELVCMLAACSGGQIPYAKFLGIFLLWACEGLQLTQFTRCTRYGVSLRRAVGVRQYVYLSFSVCVSSAQTATIKGSPLLSTTEGRPVPSDFTVTIAGSGTI